MPPRVLRQALIEQAKGVVMARERVDAERAFERLVGMSQSANRKLRSVAAQVVEEASGASVDAG